MPSGDCIHLLNGSLELARSATDKLILINFPSFDLILLLQWIHNSRSNVRCLAGEGHTISRGMFEKLEPFIVQVRILLLYITYQNYSVRAF